MKDFLKFTFASCLGVMIAGFVLFLFFVFLGIGLSSGSNKTVVNSNSVLKINFSDPIPERTNNVKTTSFKFKSDNLLGIHDVIAVINHAKNDSKIKGIYLEPAAVNLGPAQAHDLLESLKSFKEDGKFIASYADYYTQNSYYIASAADQIYVNPIGTVDFRGTAAYIPFFKEVIDKVGVKMNIYYAGNFKSATEPYRRTEMSPENRLQMSEYIGSNYDRYLEDIAAARGNGLTSASLKEKAYGFEIKNGEDAKAVGMIDEVGFKDELMDWMKEKMDLETDQKINFTSLIEYAKGTSYKKYGTGNDRIAVVFAEGTITDGKENYGEITDGQYVKIFQKLTKDDKVKAVVLRVNSGGGSMLAGEKIYQQILKLKEAGKKFVVSMGDYAASGGYYIAAPADSIFASPNTLTGSIGVFAMIPNFSQTLKDKIGIRYDTVLTGPYSGNFTPYLEWSEKEGDYLQARVDDNYQLFLQRVADGRSMSVDEVHKVAQGRVWTGAKALDLGLVDRLGDIDDAIASAASLASLDTWKIKEYPSLKNPMQKWLDEFVTDPSATQSEFVDTRVSEIFPVYDYLKVLENPGQIQARLPFNLISR